MKKVVVASAVMLFAFLLLAWIKGGAQPMQWIEQPLEPGAPAGASG